MLEDPQKISTSKISKFFEDISEVALLGLGKYQQKVMDFGKPSLCFVNTVNRFMVEWVEKTHSNTLIRPFFVA